VIFGVFSLLLGVAPTIPVTQMANSFQTFYAQAQWFENRFANHSQIFGKIFEIATFSAIKVWVFSSKTGFCHVKSLI